MYDLDDNLPLFPFLTMVVKFDDDNEAVGGQTPIPTAIDDDQGVNGTFQYELVDQSGKFELVNQTYLNTPRVQYLFLRNKSPLDYEQNAAYSLVLHAREGNSDPDQATMNIVVAILNMCDEPAYFTMSRYTVSICRDAIINTLVVVVEAIDADDMTTCPLEYSILRVCGRERLQSTCNTVNVSEQPFVLDSESDWMTLRDTIDHEMLAEYEITVEATDGFQSSTAMVVVIVEGNTTFLLQGWL